MFTELFFKPAEIEVEGRAKADHRVEVPIPDFLQSESRFTPSEKLSQRLVANVNGNRKLLLK